MSVKTIALVSLVPLAIIALAGCVSNPQPNGSNQTQSDLAQVTAQLTQLQAQYDSVQTQKTELQAALQDVTRGKAACEANLTETISENTQAVNNLTQTNFDNLETVRQALMNDSAAQLKMAQQDMEIKYKTLDSYLCLYYIGNGGYSTGANYQVPLYCGTALNDYVAATRVYVGRLNKTQGNVAQVLDLVNTLEASK
jgi:outer membrane murein-binding lipoprotein Lpp